MQLEIGRVYQLKMEKGVKILPYLGCTKAELISTKYHKFGIEGTTEVEMIMSCDRFDGFFRIESGGGWHYAVVEVSEAAVQ